MKVITDRPIYNYADGEVDYSNQDGEAKKWWQKIYQGGKTAVSSDYGKAVVGVGAEKAKQWADTGAFGNQSPLQVERGAFNTTTLPTVSQTPPKKSMGIWTKVGIGVGIAAVLGVATYFVLKAKKGKA